MAQLRGQSFFQAYLNWAHEPIMTNLARHGKFMHGNSMGKLSDLQQVWKGQRYLGHTTSTASHIWSWILPRTVIQYFWSWHIGLTPLERQRTWSGHMLLLCIIWHPVIITLKVISIDQLAWCRLSNWGEECHPSMDINYTGPITLYWRAIPSGRLCHDGSIKIQSRTGLATAWLLVFMPGRCQDQGSIPIYHYYQSWRSRNLNGRDGRYLMQRQDVPIYRRKSMQRGWR